MQGLMDVRKHVQEQKEKRPEQMEELRGYVYVRCLHIVELLHGHFLANAKELRQELEAYDEYYPGIKKQAEEEAAEIRDSHARAGPRPTQGGQLGLYFTVAFE